MSLSMMQTMAIWESGRCKCPHCGKFRKGSDFPDQPGHETFGNAEGTIYGHVHVAPKCNSCLKQEEL